MTNTIWKCSFSNKSLWCLDNRLFRLKNASSMGLFTTLYLTLTQFHASDVDLCRLLTYVSVCATWNLEFIYNYFMPNKHLPTKERKAGAQAHLFVSKTNFNPKREPPWTLVQQLTASLDLCEASSSLCPLFTMLPETQLFSQTYTWELWVPANRLQHQPYCNTLMNITMCGHCLSVL